MTALQTAGRLRTIAEAKVTLFTARLAGAELALTALVAGTAAYQQIQADIAQYERQLTKWTNRVTGYGIADSDPLSNDPPDAAITPSSTATSIGATITLDASGSSDPDGDPITYVFSLQSKPGGSAATLGAGADSAHKTLVPDLVGAYVVRVTVTDDGGDARGVITPVDLSDYVETTITAAAAPVGILTYLGWSGGALAANGWHDGTNVQTWEAATGTSGSEFVTIWQDRSLSGSINMLDTWKAYSAVGQKHYGKTAVVTIPIGWSNATIATVLGHGQDGQYQQFFQHAVDIGLTGLIYRLGHEFTINGAFNYSVDGSPTSLTNFRAAYRIIALIGLAIDPTAKFEWCGFSCFYDPTAAYPGDDVVTFIGADVYDDWQGSGSTKVSQNPYATYTSPTQAWNGLWKHDPTGATTGAGSPGWWHDFAVSRGKKFAMSEWALMARVAYPNGGGGDNPAYINGIADIIELGHTDHACYFSESATYAGQLQDHYIIGGNFPNALVAFEARF